MIGMFFMLVWSLKLLNLSTFVSATPRTTPLRDFSSWGIGHAHANMHSHLSSLPCCYKIMLDGQVKP